MGCDIHIYVEKKIDGKWVTAEGFVKSKEGNLEIPYATQFYNGRNYELFGFLAGVRRDDLQYFEDKGFPKDACTEVKERFKGWGADAHTPSWLTLKELKDALADPKAQKIRVFGMMDKKQLTEFKKEIKKEKPDWSKRFPYCEWSSSKSDVHFEVDVPIGEALHLDEWVSKLERYDWGLKDTEIRIVFWFDN